MKTRDKLYRELQDVCNDQSFRLRVEWLRENESDLFMALSPFPPLAPDVAQRVDEIEADVRDNGCICFDCENIRFLIGLLRARGGGEVGK